MKFTPSNITMFVFLCIAIALLFVLKEVQAQQKAPGLQVGTCLPAASTIGIIQHSLKEEIIFKGTNHVNDIVLISHNPLTKTWTAIQTHLQGFMCVVAYGKGGLLMPVLDDDRNSKP